MIKGMRILIVKQQYVVTLIALSFPQLLVPPMVEDVFYRGPS